MTNPNPILQAITDLALRWRYDQSATADISRDQQMVDGGILLTVLREHGVSWSSDYAAQTIAAPARTTPHDDTFTGDVAGDDDLSAAVRRAGMESP